MLQNPETNRQFHQHKTDPNEQTNQQEYKLGIFQVFRFAEKTDVFLMVIGAIGAIAVGAGLPAFAFVWGQTINSFKPSDDPSQPSLVDQTREDMLLFIYVGLGILVGGFFMYGFWTISGQRQANKCRRAYVKALLAQEIGWYDIQNQAELASKFGRDTIAFQNGIGKKIAVIIYVISTLISGFLFSFITGWTLALVMLVIFPCLGIVGGVANNIIANKDEVEKSSYSKAGGRASQVLLGIKTVKSLVGEKFEAEKYTNSLKQALRKLKKYGFMVGGTWGTLNTLISFSYALGFWFGMNCILGESNCSVELTGGRYTAGDVLTVIFALMIAGFNFSQAGPAIESITLSRSAAKRIFSVIDRKPLITNPSNPIKPQKLQGKIEFRNVSFSYPKSKSTKVLNNISFVFNKDKIGLAGESGCGKSTIVQLLMRFYDPDEGQVLIDGHNIKDFDLEWIRNKIGYVGQEPVLFATSIRQNILMAKRDASEDEIKQSLKNSEALQFVNQLQSKLQTYVGSSGSQLSGGQKQRIAISRALIKNPQILLLDQATSALDRRNEKLIQKTLNQLGQKIKTISIAHRVKTLMNTDSVIVIDKGQVQQKGNFFTLQRFKGSLEDDNEAEENTQQILEIAQNRNSYDKNESEQASSEEQDAYSGSIYRRIFSYSKNNRLIFIFAIIFALGSGVVYPLLSYFLADVLYALINLTLQTSPQIIDENKKIITDRCIYFVIIGVAAFVFSTLQSGLFSWISLEITYKIRSETFYKILQLPIPWFDKSQNNSGALSTYLSSNCLQIQGLVTGFVSVAAQNSSTIISAFIIGFYFEWRTALVTLGILPLMALSGVLSLMFQTGLDEKSSATFSESSNLIMQFIINIRTVTSFNLQKYFIDKYSEKLQESERMLVKKGIIIGLAYGVSQFIMYASFGILFFLGAIFVQENESVNTPDMFKALLALMFAGMGLGQATLFLPDLAGAKISAKQIFKILDTTTERENQVRQKSKMITSGIKGHIMLKNVDFKYENRKEYIFKNFSIQFKEFEKIGLVGKSGCGKSTIFQLLLRFYELENGEIVIDGVNIKEYDLQYLRNCLGYVGQEPILFNDSFRENIRYNCLATESDIREAAHNSNAYNFIMDNTSYNQLFTQKKVQKTKQVLEKGFDRNVGLGGSHISGGQKQRVAIARALIRQPKILLLDQATSALDKQNEMIVQHELDKLMKNKSILEIAHRLDTIKNSDTIYVFDKGRVVEQGKFEELMGLEGYFYKLEKGVEFV